MPDKAKQQAARTYNAAADSYDSHALGFWDYFGRRTVERLGLTPDAKVLDVCCGSGASAIPAAQLVGPAGEVIGVDLAANLLQLARQKAANLSLENIRFEIGDMLALKYPENMFDAVICVFGIFFVPDMALAVRELWRRIKPGGMLAITTWGKGFCEPANDIFWRTVAELRPDLYKGFNPWDRIDNEVDLVKTLAEAGIQNPKVETENRMHPLGLTRDWWTIVLGSGYRGTIEQLTAAEREDVKTTNLQRLRDVNIREVQTNAIYAVAGPKIAR